MQNTTRRLALTLAIELSSILCTLNRMQTMLSTLFVGNGRNEVRKCRIVIYSN